MAVCNNGTRMPSPQETTNGFSQPCASGTWHKAEEESRTTEPNLVKKAHREILDHERKRRVELKCMELQEMMEEQGYSEEEIHQKVGTFRQMLMEKEGVLTREDQHGRQIVIENHYMVPGEESATEYSMYGEGYTLECECHSDWYRDDSSHRDYRTKRRLSSPASPPPKKRKKKKSSHKRSRSNSGSRKKRRHRSRSPRNKKKDKIKDRKRSHSGSTTRRTHRHSSCSSHSASPSSDYSTSKSPKRQSPKHRQDGRKPSNQRSSRSLSSSCSGHSRSATTHQNGHKSGNHNGHHSDGIGNIQEKHLDRFNTMSPSSRIHVKVEMSPSQFKGKNRHDIRSPRSVSSSKGDRCSSEEKHHHRSKSASSERHHHRSRARNRSYKTCPANSGSHTGYSSDSEESVLSHTVGMDKNHGAPLKKKRVRRGRQNSCSEFSLKQPRQNSDRKKSPARSTGNRGSSWSSSCSPSRSRSREKRSVRSRSRSASQKKTANREKESDTKARHNDTEAARPRRRSRSYSPIRKRRRDSPSFMEARRITSARKRPIPYYRPSPSSSGSLSSYSHSRSRSRSYDSYSSYSRSRTQSRTPSHSRSPSYRSSSESAGF